MIPNIPKSNDNLKQRAEVALDKLEVKKAFIFSTM